METKTNNENVEIVYVEVEPLSDRVLNILQDVLTYVANNWFGVSYAELITGLIGIVLTLITIVFLKNKGDVGATAKDCANATWCSIKYPIKWSFDVIVGTLKYTLLGSKKVKEGLKSNQMHDGSADRDAKAYQKEKKKEEARIRKQMEERSIEARTERAKKSSRR